MRSSKYPWKAVGLSALIGLVWALAYYVSWNAKGWTNPVIDVAVVAAVAVAVAVLVSYYPRRPAGPVPKVKSKGDGGRQP